MLGPGETWGLFHDRVQIVPYLASLAAWLALPLCAWFLHRRWQSAPDRLATWACLFMLVALCVLVAVTCPRWSAQPAPPQQDTMRIIFRLSYFSSLALIYGFAACAFLLIGRYFPFRGLAISLVLFAGIQVGLGMGLMARLPFWLAEPGRPLPDGRSFAQIAYRGQEVLSIALLLTAVALPPSLWAFWQKRRVA